MGFFSFLGVISPVHIRWFTLTRSRKHVGTDHLGNRYYVGKPIKGYKRERRWVIYNGPPEASMIPPEWHGWMHHQTDVIPSDQGDSYRREWQKPHQPNLTGTTGAYRPPGHILKGGRRDAATGDYEAWKPE